jgi:hypothetical protein
MGPARACVVVLAVALAARAGAPRPLAERIDEATKAAVAARGLALRAPLRVREVSARELAVALGEAPAAEERSSADGTGAPHAEVFTAPMLRDDDLARACLLGLSPPGACIGDDALASAQNQGAGDPLPADARAQDGPPGARASLASLAAGVYLPRERALLVRRDEAGAADGTVLLHEAVHALQDAHFGLATLLREDARGADALMARHAFVEGDASFAVLRDANLLEPVDNAFVEAFCRGFVLSNRKAAAGSGAASPGATAGAVTNARAMQNARADSVVAPYVHGTRFVWSMYARGGWRAVNAVWRRPPETTEQLLHPEKYVRRERPVPLPRAPAPPAGYVVRAEATFGELDLRTWLGVFLDEDDAARLAAGWGNGAVTLHARGDARALTLRVRWDDDARGRAKEVTARLTAAIGGACAERSGLGPLRVEASGRDLVVRAGPDGARCEARGR